MLKFARNLILSAVIALQPALVWATPAGLQDGTLYFRYRDQVSAAQPIDPVSKDIMAFYVAGVGVEFSERLPLKPQWEDDTWVFTDPLPEGIVFDQATRSFVGTPTTPVRGLTIDMVGYDATGTAEATATINFDVFDVAGEVFEVDLYAHSGKYHVDELPKPTKNTVDHWTHVYAPPAGISVNGPYYEGTPAAAGQSRVFSQGFDFLGNVVATYVGKYVVEDGPTFPFIPDNVQPLPQLEAGWNLGPFDYKAPGNVGVTRLINPAVGARYYLEVQNNTGLPGDVASNDTPKALQIRGWVTKPYDTATVRFRAIDSDGTEGYSNWFTFGSSDPQPGCYPFPVGTLTLMTGGGNVYVPRPYGSQGVVSYHLVDGTLPDGVTLVETSGLFKGPPKKAEPSRQVTVRVDVTNGANVVSTSCAYNIMSATSPLFLRDTTAGQARHGRTGATYAGSMGVVGGIPTFSTNFSGVAPANISISGSTTDKATFPVSGTFPTVGGVQTYALTTSNGDGNSADGNLSLIAHPPLSATQGDFDIKRLAASDAWATVQYDAASIVPDVSGQTVQPSLTLASSTGLPFGIRFEDGRFFGMTREPEGRYGPFKASVSDFTGQAALTQDFYVNVTHRDEIAVSNVTPPTFVIEKAAASKTYPVAITQPPGAAGFAVTWSISGTLPSWLTFDSSDGSLTASPNIPYSAKGTYGPFTVTVTDSDNSTATSQAFSIEAKDWPDPAAAQMPKAGGTVTGSNPGETATTMSLSGFADAIDEDSVIGGRAGVSFVAASPSTPGGLTFTATSATLAGTPTEPFDGVATFSFKDSKGRDGTVEQPIEIRPYPKVRAAASAFDLPRLADASTFIAAPTMVEGFWNTPVWSLDTGTLPSGLSVDPGTGRIVGSTTADANLPPFSDIRLKAVSRGANAETLISFTDPFSITVTERQAMTLSFAPSTDTFYLQDKTNLQPYSVVTHTIASPVLGGSSAGGVTYAMTAGSDFPSGLVMNPTTGVLSWTGTPELGHWSAQVTATDKEGQTATATLAVSSTLFGQITSPVIDPNDPTKGGGPTSLLLRVGEPFKTWPLKPGNFVPPLVFTTSPETLPSPITFSPGSGAFWDASLFETPGLHKIIVGATDADDRSMKPITFNFDVKPALAFAATGVSGTATQYSSAAPLDLSFPEAAPAIGAVTYSISGTVPGTLVRKTYVNGAFVSYDWQGGSVDATTPNALDQLPLDALVFDPEARTLKGIPSQSGSFTFTLDASDDHQNGYVRAVSTQVENNSASLPVSVEVAKAADLVIQNRDAVGQADSEDLAQYTQRPTLHTAVDNVAYGKDVVWTLKQGSVPSSLTATPSGQTLYYGGYADAQGTFGGIVYEATDAAGRKAVAPAVSFNVGPRQTFALTPTTTTRNMVVDLTDASLDVTSVFPAYGGSGMSGSSWTVSGTLPPGVTASKSQNGVHFGGTSTDIGQWTVTVTGRDSQNATASATITFKVVVPPDPIQIAVSNVTTKVGYPFTMQPTASNVFGTPRFYSYDIEGGKYETELDIDNATGLVSGTFNSVQQANFDEYVTDESNRVTSKPVVVDVIPNLRVTVPQIVQFPPYQALTRTVDTAYKLGTVKYSLGPGNWPKGVTINQNTGTLSSDGTALIGSYDNLTILATDTWGALPYVDSQASNPFKIVVEPTGPYVNLQPGQLTAGEKRKDYSFDLKPAFLTYASIGTTDIIWSMSAGTGQKLAPGLTIADGILSGAPTQSGTFTFNVTATYKDDPKVKSTATYTIVVNLQQIDLKFAGTLADGDVRDPYSFDLKGLTTVQNIPLSGVAYTYTATAAQGENWPADLTLSTGGVISGTPSRSGTYKFRLTAAWSDTNPTAESLSVTIPVSLTINGSGNKWVQVATGDVHTCAVTTDKEVFCWGANGSGQLGNGTTTASRFPVKVQGIDDATFVQVGDLHSCAIVTGGAVKCWGSNSYGQLGNGTKTPSTTPVKVSSLTGATALKMLKHIDSPGGAHTCAIANGGVKCWGSDSYGVLGQNTNTTCTTCTSTVPVQAVGLTSGAAQIDIAYITTHVAMADGTLRSWGWNGESRLAVNKPANIVYGSPQTNPVVTDAFYYLAQRSYVRTDGRIFALANNGAPSTQASWAPIVTDRDLIANGAPFCAVIASSGAVQCGTLTAPTTTVSGFDFAPVQMDSGNGFSCAVLTNGNLRCWGSNTYGQLGDGTVVSRSTANVNVE